MPSEEGAIGIVRIANVCIPKIAGKTGAADAAGETATGTPSVIGTMANTGERKWATGVSEWSDDHFGVMASAGRGW